MNEKRLVQRWLGMAAVLVCSSCVWASFTDGFESGLNDWTISGQVQAVTDEYPRNLGLSNSWYPTEGTLFASLWSTDSAGINKAQLSRSFDGVAGETLLFDYYFDFNDSDAITEAVNGTEWAKAELSGAILFETDELTSGWISFDFVLPETKTYDLTFSVFDQDGTFESVLGVDRVSVGQAVVPVPGALLLGLIGVTTAGWLRRRSSL